MKIKFIILALVTILSHTQVIAQISGTQSIAVIRVEFQLDESEGTTGNGKFLMESVEFCSEIPVDPPPHNRNYFLSHLTAADEYFNTVSKGSFRFDIANSFIFPEAGATLYELSESMDYYHPFTEDSLHDQRLTQLFYDAVVKAYEIDSIDFNDFDIIIVVHPGVGQDFNLPFLDPTPEDIPSAYIDPDMLSEHLGSSSIQLGDAIISKGIILPETQNLLLYEETSSMFADAASPCDYQYSLAGTMTLMLGFHLGLPPLWNTESGASGVGLFSLMDQGSNNLSGIVPAIPDAWTRLYAGWDEYTTINMDGVYQLKTFPESPGILKVPINNDEYFLIENRINWFKDSIGIEEFQILEYEETGTYSSPLEILFNETGSVRNDNGIFIDIPNYDTGLPGSGVLIWHINENNIRNGIDSYNLNGDLNNPGLDLEEADGAQDIGFPSIHLFTDPSSGYFGDMWFYGNPEFERANPAYTGENPVFGPTTYPDTKSSNGGETGISISISGAPNKEVSVQIQFGISIFGPEDTGRGIIFSGDITGDGDYEIIGQNDSIWWSSVDELIPHEIQFSEDEPIQEIIISDLAQPAPLIGFVFQKNDSTKLFTYRYNDNNNSIEKDWESAIAGTGFYHVAGLENSASFIFKNESGYFLVSETESNWNSVDNNNELQASILTISGDTITYCAIDDGYALKNVSNGDKISVHSKIIQIAACDANADGFPEILTLDEGGYINLYNAGLISRPGFPVFTDGEKPVMIGDLTDDNKQNIVVRSRSGKIIIVSSNGNLQREIVIPDDSRIAGLGLYENISYLATTGSVYQLREEESSGLDWPILHGNSAGTRIFHLKKEVDQATFDNVLNLSKTYAYPNPSRNGSITFRISSGSANSASLDVFDLTGVQVWSQKNLILAPGRSSEFLWNTTKIESGVYIVKVSAKNATENIDKVFKIGIIQ